MRTDALARRARPSLPRFPLSRWLQVAAERRRLAELDAERLRDLGLTPAQVRREAARPFWDVCGR